MVDHTEGGFTLAELMVAMMVIIIGVFAAILVFTSSLRTSNVTSHRVDAVTLAIRDIEAMRAVPYAQLGFSSSVSGYSSTFVDNGQTYSTVTVPYSQLVPVPSPIVYRGMQFQLQREIYWVDRNGAPGSVYPQTTVKVTWTDQVGAHTVRQDAVLYPSGLGVATTTTPTTVAAGVPAAANVTSSVDVLSPTSAVNLAWTPGATPPSVTQWKIQFSTDNFVTPNDAATVTAITTTYRVTGLAAGVTYQFRVGALNGALGPSWSNVSTETMAAASGVGACQIVSETVTPSTVTRDAATHQLQSTPAVSVSTSGGCTSLTLRYEPTGSNLQVTTLTPNAAKTLWTANVLATTPWDLGDHVIAVWDNVANAEFSGSSGITVQ